MLNTIWNIILTLGGIIIILILILIILALISAIIENIFKRH